MIYFINQELLNEFSLINEVNICRKKLPDTVLFAQFSIVAGMAQAFIQEVRHSTIKRPRIGCQLITYLD
jgi:hypothetical protein